jgi:hypothetical protein
MECADSYVSLASNKRRKEKPGKIYSVCNCNYFSKGNTARTFSSTLRRFGLGGGVFCDGGGGSREISWVISRALKNVAMTTLFVYFLEYSHPTWLR